MSEELKVRMMDIDDLVPYAKNPRINQDAVFAVAKSIEEFGFKVPIVIDKNNVIINGHTRLKAARSLGMDKVPVVVADDLTEEQARAFRLADNMTGQLSGWDMDLLEGELQAIGDDFDMGDFGFPDLEEESVEDDMAEEFKEDEPAEELPRQYKVVINCKDKLDQSTILSKIQSMGYDCQPVSFQ